MKNRHMPLASRSLVLVAGIFLCSLAQSGCKKVIEKVQEDFVTNLITNNLWAVTSFKEGGKDLSDEFVPYEFKFNKNATVVGRRAGFSDALGTWSSDAVNYTITSSFPAGPTPLDKLTGKWNLDKTTLSSVEATRREAGVDYFLRLVKK